MTDLSKTKENPQGQLWKKLDEVNAGMLGVDGSGLHMQPMAQILDQDRKRLIFFTQKDSELVKTLKPGDRAHFCLIGSDHDYHACLTGPIRAERNESLTEQHWNAVVAAWFDGKTDPNMTLLIVDLENVKIWASTDSSVKFGWEILQANLTDHHPEVGVTTEISFLGDKPSVAAE